MIKSGVRWFWDNLRKGDNVLLLLCVITSAFGCLCIASATNERGFVRYVTIQSAAICIGVVLAVGLHVWKRNTLLSIGLSTVAYMLLVQFVF